MERDTWSSPKQPGSACTHMGSTAQPYSPNSAWTGRTTTHRNPSPVWTASLDDRCHDKLTSVSWSVWMTARGRDAARRDPGLLTMAIRTTMAMPTRFLFFLSLGNGTACQAFLESWHWNWQGVRMGLEHTNFGHSKCSSWESDRA